MAAFSITIIRIIIGSASLVDHLYHLVHLLCGLTNGKATYSATLGILGGYIFGRDSPQVGILTALHDGEKGLMVAVQGLCLVKAFQAAVKPAMCELHGVLRIAVVALTRSALVKSHHDVGTDDALNIHHAFRSEKVSATVNVAAEGTPLLLEFSVGSEGEYLETTAVGEQRTLPVHEAVQPSRLTQKVAART